MVVLFCFSEYKHVEQVQGPETNSLMILRNENTARLA